MPQTGRVLPPNDMPGVLGSTPNTLANGHPTHQESKACYALLDCRLQVAEALPDLLTIGPTLTLHSHVCVENSNSASHKATQMLA